MPTNRKIRKITNALDFLLFSVVYIPLSIVCKPKKRQEKIVGFSGPWFAGNLKCVYQEMAKYNDVKPFFVTSDKSEIEKLKKAGINAHFYMDVKSIPLFLATNVWVTSHGPNRIPFVGIIRRIIPFYTGKRGSKWVDLWHGIGFKHVYREKMLIEYDLGFVTSEFFNELYSSKESRISDKLRITGFPRTDNLVRKVWDRNKTLKALGIRPNKKNILYAPTYGHKKFKPFFPWGDIDSTIDAIEDFCRRNNCNFLLRMHPLWDVSPRNIAQKEKLEEKIEQMPYIFQLPLNNFSETERILFVSDVLVTDWSSTANDFIPLHRPIIFLDVELPVKEFVFKPEERAGYVVRNRKEFFQKLQEALVHPNLFEKKRRALIKKLYKYLDGNSSKRCVAEIMKLLRD